MNEITRRLTAEDLFRIKLKFLRQMEEFVDLDQQISDNLKDVNGYRPYNIRWEFHNYHQARTEKYIDQYLWRYLVKLYFLEKYMLCSEYAKMMKEIEELKTPDFTPENAEAWLTSLKSMIYENIRLMCKRVYEKLITGSYETGSGFASREKKRNNNGVDKFFILQTYDYLMMYNYWSGGPTITDDLEKVCYILDGKSVPDKTLKTLAKINHANEADCSYFKVKFCKNGNTHFFLTDETVGRLNKIGPDGNLIGEKIRIKEID
ncbi:MAG: DUF4942 domain-containing protein [Desulfobacteraceae bacterium]|jgi:hypothetical protein